jgi:hypothetical protein
MAKHHYVHRRHNPFAAGSLNKLAVKGAGVVAGLVGASSVPPIVSPSLNVGWGGVGMALVVAFGGAFLLNKMSADVGEGFLLGGVAQAASRAITMLTGRTLLTAGMGQYGPLNFTIPTPAYSQAAPAIAASASKTSGTKASMPATAMAGARRAYSKYVS